MDSRTVELLANAAAALDAAAEGFESGSPEWEMTLGVQKQAETLIAHEVNGTWPQMATKPASVECKATHGGCDYPDCPCAAST